MHRGNGTTYNLLEQSKIRKDHQARDPTHNVTAQDNGPPASHCLATVHPFTVSPSGPNQGEQLGQGELFNQGELLVIPLYTNSNTDKLIKQWDCTPLHLPPTFVTQPSADTHQNTKS